MKVVLIEDMLLLRDGLSRSLRDLGIDTVGEAGSGVDAVELIERTRPDVAIIDIRMPPTFTDEGLKVAAQLRARFPLLGILVLSQYLETAYAIRLLRDAPERSGYLLKDRVMHMATLVDALTRITEGETVIDPTIVSRVMGRRRRGPGARQLSNREVEVLALLAEGLSNRAIAERLVINERTIETHINQIFVKLGLETSPETHRRVLAVLTFLRSASAEE
ncbi:MAG: LuxR C-terminal-related transcriptional regulator [Ilumatobacteraceae bacterium]